MKPEDLVGKKLGKRYLLRRVIGRGGMGVVYEAENVAVGKRVALKLLAAELTASPEHLVRFQREARAAAAIGHPNIVDVYDFGQDGPGLVYFVMELLAGRSVAKVVHAAGHLGVARAVDIAGQTLSALAAAHQHGIVHRDVKPDNIFLCRKESASWVERPSHAPGEERVKVLDFGISLFTEVGPRVREEEDPQYPGIKLTGTGVILGTASYMSPEQASAQPSVDRRTDIWAVAAVLYYMLAGRPPFRGSSTIETLYKVLKARPEPLAGPDGAVPPALWAVVERGLAKDPAARYPDAESFVDALRPFADKRAAPDAAIAADEPIPVAEAAHPMMPTPSGIGTIPLTLITKDRPRADVPRRSRRGLKAFVASASATLVVALLLLWLFRGGGGPGGRAVGPGIPPPGADASPVSALVPPAVDNAPRPEGASLPGAAETPATPPEEEPAATVALPPIEFVVAASPEAGSAAADAGGDAIPTASLQVRGTQGASLALDGVDAGEVPTTIAVPADGQMHTITAWKRGFANGQWVVGPFRPGESTGVEVRLRPGTGGPPRPPPGGPVAGTGPAATGGRDATGGRTGPAIEQGPSGTLIRTAFPGEQ